MELSSGTPITVSVCVANYNGEAVIGPCLKSILDQQAQASIEIIVHDDASSDASLEVIRQQFPQVRLIVSEENRGFCASNNIMVAEASGEYILLLNNDAWLAEDAIATLLAGAQRWGRSVLTLAQYEAPDGGLLDCGMFMDLLANPIHNEREVDQPVAMVMGACLWLPRELWDYCGGFPAWFGSMAEDMYLCNYSRLLGFPVVALAGSRYHHHVGHSFGGGKVVAKGLATTFKRRRLSERNKLYVMFLFYPALALVLILPLQLLALFLEGLVLALVKLDGRVFTRIYGFALGSFLGQLPHLWRERRVIQRRRKVGLLAYFSVFRWLPHKLRMLWRHGLPELR